MRGVLVSVERIVSEDTGAAVTISESAQVQIYVMQMRHLYYPFPTPTCRHCY